MNADNHDAEVLGAIEAFEQIHAVMPQDPTTLEALVDAYQQINKQEEANHYRLLLGEALLEDGDENGALNVAAELAPFASQSAQIKDFLSRCENLERQQESPFAVRSSIAVKTPTALADRFADLLADSNMAEELLFAWNLMQAGLVSAEEYGTLLQDMTGPAAEGSMTPVSVLHTLEACAFRNLERIYAYIVQKTATPYITLSSVTLQPPPVFLLPVDVMLRRGVLPFGMMGDDVLIVIMNPFNTKLRSALDERMKGHCHFYITLASEFDEALLRAQTIYAEHEESKR